MTDATFHTCPGASATEQFICNCHRITEAEFVETVVNLGLRTFEEVRRCTPAGDGCTCCHRRLRECLERHACPGSSSALPICSVK